MKKQNKFETAYLKAIKLIKEDVDDASTEKTGTPENQVKVITFKTSDPGLIDAFTNGFEKITISKMGEQEKIEDIEFVKDLFGDINVTTETEVEECGDVAVEEAETEVEECDEIQGEDDETEVDECGDIESEEDEIEITEEDTECATCNGTGVCEDENGEPYDCEDCKGTGTCECGDLESEEDETKVDECNNLESEEDDETEIDECNAFESALKRIKNKYLI